MQAANPLPQNRNRIPSNPWLSPLPLFSQVDQATLSLAQTHQEKSRLQQELARLQKASPGLGALPGICTVADWSPA